MIASKCLPSALWPALTANHHSERLVTGDGAMTKHMVLQLLMNELTVDVLHI